jgi:hypothetical protein
MKMLSSLLSLTLGLVSAAIATGNPSPSPIPNTPRPEATQPGLKASPKPTAKPTSTAGMLDEKEIVGNLITRAGPKSGYINIKIEDGRFTMYFYDSDKLATAPDVNAASVTFQPGKAIERRYLTSDGTKLQSPVAVKPPYHFRGTRVALLPDAEGSEVEAYVIFFNQTVPGEGQGIPADEMTPEQAKKVK